MMKIMKIIIINIKVKIIILNLLICIIFLCFHYYRLYIQDYKNYSMVLKQKNIINLVLILFYGVPLFDFNS